MYHIASKYVEPRTGASHVQDVSSFGGSILAVRRLGDSGRKQNQIDALRTLRLKHIDDACIVDDSHGSVFGNAVVSQHLLRFHQLSAWVPPGRYSDLWVEGDGSLMYRQEYSDASGPGEILVVGNGEYVQADTVEGYLTASWTSDKSAEEFFRSARAALGEPVAGDAAAFVQLDLVEGDGAEGAGSFDEVLDYVVKKTPPLTYMRVAFAAGATAIWTAPASRLAGHTAAFSELAVRLPVESDRAGLLALLSDTASASLKATHDLAIGRIQQFAA